MRLSEDHQMIRDMAREFAEQELTNSILDQVEESHEFPQEILDQMAEIGFFGIKFSEEYGGSGMDLLSYALIMEEIARKSAVASIYVSSPNSLVGTPLDMFGTEEQKQKYLAPLISGEITMCFGLTESDAGSDAGGIKTRAIQDGENYIINGSKTFITAAPLSDYAIIFAVTDPEAGTRGITSFIVDMKQKGVSCGKPEDKMGIVGCPTSDIYLDNVVVSKDNILGELNKGWLGAMKALDVGRIGIAAQAVGIAQAALEEAIKYSKERKQFGRPICKFQAIAFKLADMATKVETARLLLHEAAATRDAGEDATKLASMAKLYCAEICNQVVYEAVQIHGGYGYIKEYKVERLYRDARITTIYEGTSEVQRLVISGQILKD